MPIEMRRLVFSDAEVAEAINVSLKAEWSKLQMQMDQGRAMGKRDNLDGGGAVMKLTVLKLEDDQLEFKAQVKTARGNMVERVYSTAEMMHLLIALCRAQKIPLARAAQKTLRKAKVGYALDLTIRKWPQAKVSASAKMTTPSKTRDDPPAEAETAEPPAED